MVNKCYKHLYISVAHALLRFLGKSGFADFAYSHYLCLSLCVCIQFA